MPTTRAGAVSSPRSSVSLARLRPRTAPSTHGSVRRMLGVYWRRTVCRRGEPLFACSESLARASVGEAGYRDFLRQACFLRQLYAKRLGVRPAASWSSRQAPGGMHSGAALRARYCCAQRRTCRAHRAALSSPCAAASIPGAPSSTICSPGKRSSPAAQPWRPAYGTCTRLPSFRASTLPIGRRRE
jgi:hypothetical protein